MPASRSAAFEAFVAPARRRPALWRLAAGISLAAAIWLATAFAFLHSAAALGAGPRGVLLLYLASFLGLGLGAAVAARVHRRPAASLIGPGGFRPGSFGLGVGTVAAVAFVTTTASAGIAPPVPQASLAEWARLLPLALPLVLVQTGAEELFFRGYLTQALAARFRSPLVWACLPSFGFGALHWDGGLYGADAWLGVLAAATVGLAFTDVTARTGNLSAAIGLHFANNVFALLVIAMPGPTSALALSVSPVDALHPMRAWLCADIATTLLVWGAWRLALARLHSRGRGSI